VSLYELPEGYVKRMDRETLDGPEFVKQVNTGNEQDNRLSVACHLQLLRDINADARAGQS
jgi:hypothetical protein